MAADLGKAYVNIIPKAPGISSNIEGILGGGEAAAGAQKAGTGLGKKLLAGVAALGIGKVIVSTIKQAFEAGGKLEQSFGGLETIFEGASVQAKAFAMNAASMGISANTYAEQAVSMGAALKAAFGGDNVAAVQAANTAIMDMADNAAKMGTPIENLQAAYQGFAKGNYTMLDNLKLGYGGTKTEMERLLADAEKFSGVKYDISNLGDVYEAIHVIQGELGLTGVAADEAKTTLQGSAGALKASWENVMAAMTTGEGLNMALAKLQESVGDFVGNVFRMLQTMAPQIPPLLKGLAKTVIDNAPEFIASGIELVVQLAAGLLEGLPQFIDRIPEIGAKAKAAFTAIDWQSLGRQALEAIGNGLKALGYKIAAAAKEVAKKGWDAFKNYDWKDLGKKAIEAIRDGLSELASLIWEKMKEIAASGWDAFKRWITGRGDSGGGGGSDSGSGRTDKGFTRNQAPAGIYRAAMDTAQAPRKAAGTGVSEEDLARALSGVQIETVVVLQGDAGKVFKVVSKENHINMIRTGRNLLAARG